MLGAITGDVVGSRFEWHNIKTKEFEFLNKDSFVTDDSLMTLAVARALTESDGSLDRLSGSAVFWMKEIGKRYPDCGFGGKFRRWVLTGETSPYNSFGNGSAMRVSPCGFAARSLDEALAFSDAVTCVTHNHPEGMKGARAATAAIFLARQGKPISEIRAHIEENYYPLDFTLDGIRGTYQFNEICQDTVPQAIEAFLESNSFEDAIRNAISIGGDSDTLAAITGGIAEAFYGVPSAIREKILTYFDPYQRSIFDECEAWFKRR